MLVAGGGIGGMACALALAREGLNVELFEQSPEIGEIASSWPGTSQNMSVVAGAAEAGGTSASVPTRAAATATPSTRLLLFIRFIDAPYAGKCAAFTGT